MIVFTTYLYGLSIILKPYNLNLRFSVHSLSKCGLISPISNDVFPEIYCGVFSIIILIFFLIHHVNTIRLIGL